jgi:Ca2+-binding EF-hand superfamily protein
VITSNYFIYLRWQSDFVETAKGVAEYIPPNRMREVFDELDWDRDGKISLRDFLRICQSNEHRK